MRSVSRPPLARVVRIDAAVRADRFPNANTLAAELEVAPRTVQRDMEFMLDQLGAPLVYNRVRHGYYYSEPAYHLPFQQVTDYLDAGFRAVRGSGPAREVRLRFRPAAARYIRERQWHKTQTLQDEPDGSLILTLRINHTLEVKRLALSWGADCEVLEPAGLRDEIVQELARAAEVYAARPP